MLRVELHLKLARSLLEALIKVLEIVKKEEINQQIQLKSIFTIQFKIKVLKLYNPLPMRRKIL